MIWFKVYGNEKNLLGNSHSFVLIIIGIFYWEAARPYYAKQFCWKESNASISRFKVCLKNVYDIVE